MYRSLSIAFLLLAFAPGLLHAQPAPPENLFDLNLGIGVGWSDYSLFSVVGSIDRHTGPVLFSTRGTVSAATFGDSFLEAGVLVGLSSNYVSLSAGPALAGIYRDNGALYEPTYPADGSAKNDEVLVPGLAIAGTFPLVHPTASHPIGLMLYGFANVNREQPFGGLALTLRFRP